MKMEPRLRGWLRLLWLNSHRKAIAFIADSRADASARRSNENRVDETKPLRLLRILWPSGVDETKPLRLLRILWPSGADKTKPLRLLQIAKFRRNPRTRPAMKVSERTQPPGIPTELQKYQ
jgi:hypothetical protein